MKGKRPEGVNWRIMKIYRRKNQVRGSEMGWSDSTYVSCG